MRIIHCLCLETLLELRVEAVVFVDGLQLMISSQQMHLFWQCQFEWEEKHNDFQRVIATIHVVPEEEVLSFCRGSACVENTKQVVVLPVGISTNVDRGLKFLKSICRRFCRAQRCGCRCWSRWSSLRWSCVVLEDTCQQDMDLFFVKRNGSRKSRLQKFLDYIGELESLLIGLRDIPIVSFRSQFNGSFLGASFAEFLIWRIRRIWTHLFSIQIDHFEDWIID